MTKEQVKNWIVEQIKKNPKLAKEYKEKKLERLNAELKLDEKSFNKKGDPRYKDQNLSNKISEIQESIKKAEKWAPEALFIDDFVSKYENNITSTKNEINDRIMSYNDEDLYIAGVFQHTRYSFIRSQQTL